MDHDYDYDRQHDRNRRTEYACGPGEGEPAGPIWRRGRLVGNCLTHALGEMIPKQRRGFRHVDFPQRGDNFFV
jgi:hypothetical protein